MDHIFRPAAETDIAAIYGLYENRVRWMDQNGLRQWNVTDYLNVYTPAYFQKQLADGRLFVLEHAGGIVGAAVLLRADSRWDGVSEDACYIHNLVTDPSAGGMGGRLLAELEGLAAARGDRFLRLDCADDNAFLNAWYESLGFRAVGRCRDGSYSGIRREKRLPPPAPEAHMG